jgi:hypothetical protein
MIPSFFLNGPEHSSTSSLHPLVIGGKNRRHQSLKNPAPIMHNNPKDSSMSLDKIVQKSNNSFVFVHSANFVENVKRPSPAGKKKKKRRKRRSGLPKTPDEKGLLCPLAFRPGLPEKIAKAVCCSRSRNQSHVCGGAKKSVHVLLCV